MSSSKGPIGGTLAIEVQLKAEAAYGLKTLGLTLEKEIGELQKLRQHVQSLSGRARETKLAEYRKRRGETEHRKWCLIVQREAMGLYNHDDVEELYRVPPALD
jgi:hypothetical protein